MKIYFDENTSPYLAKGLNILEQPLPDGYEVLSIKDVFGQGIEDEKWIPLVGKENGIVITQDIHIQRNINQRELYKEYGVGIFFIKPPSKIGYQYWEMVEYVVAHWREFKKLISDTKKPFAFKCPCRGKIEPL